MGFGAPPDMISTNTANTAQVAEKTDAVGSITEMKTYGAVEEKTEEYFSTTMDNEAVNGQTGSTSTGVVTSHTLNEVNTEYARETKVTRKPLAAPA